MNFTKRFQDLGKGDAGIAGGKGASLGEMTQAGIPVPPGFVILSQAFEHFIKKADLNVEIDAILHTVSPSEMHTVKRASEKIQGLILAAEMPEDVRTEVMHLYTKLDAPYVAVRSSATAEDSAEAAWAGQLDSFLNTTEATLLENVQRCWASLFTPRAIFYRFEKELHTQKISVAVVVQKMVNSEISGIAFSVHPVTEDHNQLIIEAGFGLGEAIVSGSVTPDSYVVEKTPRRIIDTNVGTQSRALYRVKAGGNEWKDILEPKASSQVLTEEQILGLSEIILTIENHYGFPCDIEWAYESGKFYIVQSRPITTLSQNQVVSGEKKELVKLRRRFIPVLWPIYTYWCGVKKMTGVPVRVFHIWEKSDAYTSFVSQELLEKAGEWKYRLMASTDSHTLRGRSKKYGDALIAHAKQFALDSSNKTLVDFVQFYKKADELYEKLFLHNIIFWATGNDNIARVIDQELAGRGEGERKEIWDALSAPTESSYSDEEERSFAEVVSSARMNGIDAPATQKAIRQFSERYIWFPFEYGGPEIYDVPTVTKRVQNELAQKNDKETTKTSRQELQKEVIKKYDLSDEVVRHFSFLQTIALLQDDRKAINAEACYYVNKLVLEKLERASGVSVNLLRFVDTDLLTEYATHKDVEAFKAQLEKRLETLVILENDTSTTFIEGARDAAAFLDQKSVPWRDTESSAKSEFKGQSAYPGKVRGTARLLRHSGEGEKLKDGEILVTYMTTPDFVPLMRRAVAVITEEGGITSHAAIVARELKKPCIIGTKHAMATLHDGDKVEVDADRGVVKILEQ
jgi:phosphoenolpyruvate synthase/pyruvate phosphate dikinase